MFGAMSGNFGAGGGQAAAGNATGKLAGYGAVETIKTNAQNRKIQQERFALEKEAKLSDLERQHMKTMAQKTLSKESGAMTADNFAALDNKMKAIEAKVKKSEGSTFNGILNTFLGSDNPDAEIDGINARLTPDIRAAYGLKGDVRSLEEMSGNDRRMMVNHLTKIDPAIADMLPEEQKKRIDAAFASKRYLNADGKVMDVYGLSVATGAANTMDANGKSNLDGRLTQSTETMADGSTVGTVDATQIAAHSNEGTEVKVGAPTEAPVDTADIPAMEPEPGTEEQMPQQGVIPGGVSENPEEKAQQIDDYVKDVHGISTQEEYDALSLEEKNYIMDDVETIFNGDEAAAGLAAVEDQPADIDFSGDTTGTAPVTQVAAYNSESNPAGETVYKQGSSNRNAVLHQLAGWSDSRTAMNKDLDFIADKLGPNATVNDVMSTYREIKQSSSGGSGYSWERAIETYTGGIQEQVRNGDITAEQGLQKVQKYTKDVLTKQSSGVATVREHDDIDTIGNQQGVYDDAMVKGIVSPATLNMAKAQEAGLPETDETKKLKTQVRDTAKIVHTGRKLSNKIAELEKSGKLNRGFLDQLKQTALEYASSGQLSDESLEKLHTSAGIDTELSMFAADYLRALSGTAASENERKATFQRLGAGFGIQPGVTVARINAFSDANADKVRLDADTLARGGFAGSALTGLQTIGDLRQPDQKQTTVVQQEYTKPMKESTAPSANSQLDNEALTNAQPVERESVMLDTPGTKFKNSQGKWVTNLGNGRIHVED